MTPALRERRELVRPGVRLGVDVGTVRIGVAVCDPDGLIATPVETIQRGESHFDRLASLVADRSAIEVVVGLPRALSGRQDIAAEQIRGFAEELADRIAPCPVRLWDERLTTAVAMRSMRASGVSSRQGRGKIDQAAAMVILQDALDAERANGVPPGEILARK